MVFCVVSRLFLLVWVKSLSICCWLLLQCKYCMQMHCQDCSLQIKCICIWIINNAMYCCSTKPVTFGRWHHRKHHWPSVVHSFKVNDSWLLSRWYCRNVAEYCIMLTVEGQTLRQNSCRAIRLNNRVRFQGNLLKWYESCITVRKWSSWGLSMFRYDQFQDACCWERNKSLKVKFDCNQYLFFLQ